MISPLKLLQILRVAQMVAKPKHPQQPQTALKHRIEKLGPLFVKFGQMLATRQDLLTKNVSATLNQLLDAVSPFSSKQAVTIVEHAYQAPVTKTFASFEEHPLASASIAQVHAATLHSGESVVVKILRPNIHKQVKRDLKLLRRCAVLLELCSSTARQLRLKDVVQEFENILRQELDLLNEAANASQLRRNFENSPLLYVPEIHWAYARRNVLVLERIVGTPIAHVEQLQHDKVNLKCLAERGVEIFFTQVFRDCFFHADMHAGNIFVAKYHPQQPQYIAVDFGIMGGLSPQDQQYLAANLLAFFKRDYRRVAELHVKSGWVSPDTRIEDFETAIRSVCEPIFQRPLKDISFGQLLTQLFQTARHFNMTVQPQLVLLQKTLLSVEALGRRLYPDLDLWQTAMPFMEQWMKQQSGAKALLSRLPELPQLLNKALNHLDNLDNPPPAPTPTVTRKSSFLFYLGLASLSACSAVVLLSHHWLPSQLTPAILSWSLGAIGIIGLFGHRN